MVVPRKYQFNDLVNLKFLARLGTFAIAMTSLKETIWTAVTIPITYRCPENIAAKKTAIITNVQMVRVMKVCFFFSYSDTGGVWT